MGVIIGSAVVPVAYCLCWSKCTAKAAIAGAICGLIAGVVSWLSTAYALYGEISLASTGNDYPMLTGNLFAIFGSAIICTAWSLVQPDAYDWQTTREIPMVDDNETGVPQLPLLCPLLCSPVLPAPDSCSVVCSSLV